MFGITQGSRRRELKMEAITCVDKIPLNDNNSLKKLLNSVFLPFLDNK